MLMKKRYTIIVFLLAVAFLSSCFSARRGISGRGAEAEVVDLSSINRQYADAENVTYNFSFNFSQSGGSSMSGFGKMQIILDSSILVSLRASFGLKLAEICLMRDSARVYVPARKGYKALGYKELTNKYGLPFDYHSYECLLLANLFSYPFFVPIDSSKFWEDDGLVYLNNIYAKDDPKKLYVRHKVNLREDDCLVSKVEVNDYLLGRAYRINYADYEIADSLLFAHEIQIAYRAKDSVGVRLKSKNVRFNSAELKTFKVPSDAKSLNF